MIPYGRQHITQTDIDAVAETLRSDWLTQGPTTQEFERQVADYCGANHAITTNSATSALHIACLALDLGPGDRLWTSPNTFVASANCARYCGAEVDFVDIDPLTFNLCPNALAIKLEQAAAIGQLPKIVIPVHFAGESCAMREIHSLSQIYGFHIIEDASHAVGGRYLNAPVGNCRYSAITVFSFHPVKIITTGEGGMALTNNIELARRMARLRSHGITRDASEMTVPPDGDWYYQQLELGFNYRMSDIQASLGISQMKRLEQFLQRRQELAKRYDEQLAGLPLALQQRSNEGASAHHLYAIRLAQTLDRKTVFRRMREHRIGVNVHYIPVHLQPYYRKLGFQKGSFPNAEAYYDSALSLPLHPGLSISEQDFVVQTLTDALT